MYQVAATQPLSVDENAENSHYLALGWMISHYNETEMTIYEMIFMGKFIFDLINESYK